MNIFDEAFMHLKCKQTYLKGYLTEYEGKDLSIIRTSFQRKLDFVPNASSIEKVGKEDLIKCPI